MGCKICLTKRKTRFDTARISICQNCIKLLLDTPVNPSVLKQGIVEIIERNFKAPSLNDIEQEAKDIVSRKNGFWTTIFMSFFLSQKYSVLLTKEGKALYDKYDKEIKQIRAQKFNEIIDGTYVPIEEYFFVNKYRGTYGTGCKKALEPWEMNFIKYYRAYQLNILSPDASLQNRLNIEESRKMGAFVKEEDGYECNLCHRQGKDIEFHVHHIIPLSLFGANHPNNLVVLCYKCHQKQHPDFKITSIKKK